MGTEDLNSLDRWLEERELRYKERDIVYQKAFNDIDRKIDNFATQLNGKMDELLRYIKQLEERRAEDSLKINNTSDEVERQRDDIKELFDWKEQVEKDYKFLDNINSWAKFIVWVVAITTITVTVLSVFGYEPMLKLISLVK